MTKIDHFISQWIHMYTNMYSFNIAIQIANEFPYWTYYANKWWWWCCCCCWYVWGQLLFWSLCSPISIFIICKYFTLYRFRVKLKPLNIKYQQKRSQVTNIKQMHGNGNWIFFFCCCCCFFLLTILPNAFYLQTFFFLKMRMAHYLIRAKALS